MNSCVGIWINRHGSRIIETDDGNSSSNERSGVLNTVVNPSDTGGDTGWDWGTGVMVQGKVAAITSIRPWGFSRSSTCSTQ